MALEDFERQLAEEKETERRRERRREREREHKSERAEGRHHRHHRRDSKHHDSHYDDEGEDSHRSKRSRHSRDDDGSERRHRHSRDDEGPDSRRKHRRDEDDEEKRRRHSRDEEASESRHKHRHRHHRRSRGESDAGEDEKPTLQPPAPTELKRDSWMEAPSALDIDYVQRKPKEPSPPRASTLGANFELKIHEKELNHHLRDLQNGKAEEELENEPAEHEVDYTFGDAGSQWRMTRLKAVYRKATESGRKVEDVALEQYDSLRDFDDAREEETELDRRKTYGKGYVGKDKPSGELFEERKLATGHRRGHQHEQHPPDTVVEQVAVPTSSTDATKRIDQTSLNKMKAQLMKAHLRKDPKAAELEREYNAAVETFSSQPAEVITLGAMESRMLAGARPEVKAMTSGRDVSRGNVQENEDMTIEEMVAEERRTRGQRGGEGYRAAERIAKDGKYDNDLDYMDENASKLAKRVHQSDTNLRNVAISDYQKLNRILQNCPLCHQEDTNTPPTAPVVSLGTRAFLTLCTEPELSPQSTMIVPTEHHKNLIECDDDEWEEIRNFMKSLTRMYHAQHRAVIFYENAAFPNRHPHAALTAVPLPLELGETAPAFFREAFLSAEDEWSQHKKIIDTLAKAKSGLGKLAFRRSLVAEMPYFHVWFEMDGGIGHVVEDPQQWPKGDLFAREIIGGMLGSEPEVIKKQGRWQRGDKRVESFRAKWRKYDWTRVLTEGA